MNQQDVKILETFLHQIVVERSRQDSKFGERNDYSPERWLVILMEEVGEVSTAILENDVENYLEELIHVAAVAAAASECLKRQQQNGQYVEVFR